jgi:hypothetical protein
MGVIRELLTQSVPEPMRHELADVMDSATTKLGGKPVEHQALVQMLPHRDEPKPNGLHDAPPANFDL